MTSTAAQAAVATATPTAVPTFAVPTAAPPEPVTGVGAMVEIVLALAFVLALILAIAWISRRLRVGSHADGLIRILAEVSLGQKERAVLLQVDGRRLLVGVGAGAISLLHAADAPVDEAAAGSDAPASLPSTPSFAMLLRRSLGRS
jgi:flagellar protein FliO/FliZ